MFIISNVFKYNDNIRKKINIKHIVLEEENRSFY